MYVSISPLVSFSLFSLPFLLFPFPSPPSLVYYPLDPYSCSLFSGHFRPPLSLHITGPRCEVPVASCFRWPIVRRVHTRSASSLSAQLSHHPLPIFNKSLPNQPTTRLNRSTLDQPLPPPVYSSSSSSSITHSLARTIVSSKLRPQHRVCSPLEPAGYNNHCESSSHYSKSIFILFSC